MEMHLRDFSTKNNRGGGKSGFPKIGGGGAATCSKWSGYTANNVGLYYTAVGLLHTASVTHSICRCRLASHSSVCW